MSTEDEHEDLYFTVTVEATLSLRVEDVLADSEEEAINQILDELPLDFCGTGQGLTILQTRAERKDRS